MPQGCNTTDIRPFLHGPPSQPHQKNGNLTCTRESHLYIGLLVFQCPPCLQHVPACLPASLRAPEIAPNSTWDRPSSEGGTVLGSRSCSAARMQSATKAKRLFPAPGWPNHGTQARHGPNRGHAFACKMRGAPTGHVLTVKKAAGSRPRGGHAQLSEQLQGQAIAEVNSAL